MGLRFGKRLKIGPGLYVNLSKSGISWSLQLGPLTNTWSKRGRRTTLDLPGSGLWYVFPEKKGNKTSTTKPATRNASPSTPATPAAQPATGSSVPSPGFLAPAVEKRFAQGLRALVDGDTTTAIERFEQAVEADSHERHASDDLMAGVALLQAGRADDAIPYLDAVVTGDAPLPDEMMQRYIGELVIPTPVTSHISFDVPMSSLGAILLLAEAYQMAGDLFGATGVMEALFEQNPDSQILRLSLAELYYTQGLDSGILELTDGQTLTDNVSYGLLIYRASALLAEQHLDAALAVANTLLQDRRKRPSPLIEHALFARGMIYEAKGQKTKALADFEKLYARNSSYPGLNEWMDSLKREPAFRWDDSDNGSAR